jgi:hypothetical protein
VQDSLSKTVPNESAKSACGKAFEAASNEEKGLIDAYRESYTQALARSDSSALALALKEIQTGWAKHVKKQVPALGRACLTKADLAKVLKRNPALKPLF